MSGTLIQSTSENGLPAETRPVAKAAAALSIRPSASRSRALGNHSHCR